MRKLQELEKYRSSCDITPAQRGRDLRHAATVLLELEYAHGTEAVNAALAIAKKSELRFCGLCEAWTRHEEGRCTNCAPLGLPTGWTRNLRGE